MSNNPSELVIYPFTCPFCVGGRATADPGSERCHHCSGIGLTDEPYGPAERAPRPPAVMRAPCADCAYRDGSPEQEHGIPLPSARPSSARPFFCHQGLPLNASGEYAPVATYRNLPLGAMVCAGWWAVVTGDDPPTRPYRDVPITEADAATRWGATPYVLRDTTQEAVTDE